MSFGSPIASRKAEMSSTVKLAESPLVTPSLLCIVWLLPIEYFLISNTSFRGLDGSYGPAEDSVTAFTVLKACASIASESRSKYELWNSKCFYYSSIAILLHSRSWRLCCCLTIFHDWLQLSSAPVHLYPFRY